MHERFRKYYGYINGGANLSDIHAVKEEMLETLIREIRHIMEIQLFFSIILLLLGRLLLSRLGMPDYSIAIFSFLVPGCYMFAVMFVIIQVMLYFDDRKGALLAASFFLFSTIVFSLLSLKWGEDYFGLGFLIASFCSLLIGAGRLAYYIKNIDYFVFCSQPLIHKEKVGLFTKLLLRFEKNGA